MVVFNSSIILLICSLDIVSRKNPWIWILKRRSLQGLFCMNIFCIRCSSRSFGVNSLTSREKTRGAPRKFFCALTFHWQLLVSQFEGVFGSFTCIFWHYKLNFEMERSGTIANVWFSQIFCIESWLFGLIVLCCLANCLSKFPLLTKVSFSMSVIS